MARSTLAGEIREGSRLTDQKPELDPKERRVLEAEWAALVEKARWLALKLGYPNPFPTRKERREAKREAED